jgi:hypothetical protein
MEKEFEYEAKHVTIRPSDEVKNVFEIHLEESFEDINIIDVPDAVDNFADDIELVLAANGYEVSNWFECEDHAS